MTDISTFVRKHRREVKDISIGDKVDKLPWYKKPIERNAFISREGKDGKHYARHKEWSKEIWVGPYNTIQEVDELIDSYVRESEKEPLNRITINHGIHSVYVDDIKTFFK